jgi:hypothetical protein
MLVCAENKIKKPKFFQYGPGRKKRYYTDSVTKKYFSRLTFLPLHINSKDQ